MFFAVTSLDLRLEAGGPCKPADVDLERMSECCTWGEESQLSSDMQRLQPRVKCRAGLCSWQKDSQLLQLLLASTL